ncbi:phage gp6-like head-tail connector protein [bacterium]|nr:phage gp6-like head-tail connector protein [bacterium]
MAYVTVQFVREITGLTDVDADDAKITDLIETAEAIIDYETGKSWSESDEGFKLVQLATAKLVGWLIFRSLAGAEQKADKFKEEAYEFIEKLKDKSELFLRG